MKNNKAIICCIFIIVLLLVVNGGRQIVEGLDFNGHKMREAYSRNSIKINPNLKYIEKCNGNDCMKKYYYHSGNDTIPTYLSDNKCITNHILKKNGLPVPNFICIRLSTKFINDYENMIRYKLQENKLKYPLVMKLSNGSYGMNIIVNIKSLPELLHEFKRLVNDAKTIGFHSKHIIIEEMVKGYRDYRILISNDHIIKITEKTEVFVIGDGISTVDKLAKLKGIHTINRELNSVKNIVLKKGEKMILSDIKNGKNGSAIVGIPVSSIHPDNVKLMRDAMKTIGLTVSGIDFLTPDITKSWRQVGGIILEMNSNPANVERNVYDKQTYDNSMDLLVNSMFV